MAKVTQLHNNIDRTRNYILQRVNTIGRSPDCNIFCDNKRVSRHHARIARLPRSESYFVEDVSTRGVYVNFKRIRGRHPLREGDRICILHFRNIHPTEMERLQGQELKDCCDDPRNHGIQSIVDLTFGVIEVANGQPEDQQQPDQQEKPKGLLARLKALFGGGKPKEPAPASKPDGPLPAKKPLPAKRPMPAKKPDQPAAADKPKKKDDAGFKSSRPGRIDL